MIAAGISLIVNRLARLASLLLGVMLLVFMLLLHSQTLINDSSVMHWTRALQDAAIAMAAFMLAKLLTERQPEKSVWSKIAGFCPFLFAVLLIVFGIEQFLNLDFLTAKAPVYLPGRIIFVYFTGALMCAVGASVLISKKARGLTIALGAWMMLLNLFNYAPALVSNSRSAILLTAAMLDLTITCGVFILANSTAATERAHFLTVKNSCRPPPNTAINLFEYLPLVSSLFLFLNYYLRFKHHRKIHRIGDKAKSVRLLMQRFG